MGPDKVAAVVKIFNNGKACACVCVGGGLAVIRNWRVHIIKLWSKSSKISISIVMIFVLDVQKLPEIKVSTTLC